MREVLIGNPLDMMVVAIDQPSLAVYGGANHKYGIIPVEPNMDETSAGIAATIDFQKGTVAKEGVNGFQNEDLIRIIMDRLVGFQVGDYACLENAVAFDFLMLALKIMEHRTINRKKQLVEGEYAQRPVPATEADLIAHLRKNAADKWDTMVHFITHESILLDKSHVKGLIAKLKVE